MAFSVFPSKLEDVIDRSSQPLILSARISGTLVIHLPGYLFVCHTVDLVVFREVAGIEQALVLANIPVYELCLDIEEEAIRCWHRGTEICLRIWPSDDYSRNCLRCVERSSILIPT